MMARLSWLDRRRRATPKAAMFNEGVAVEQNIPVSVVLRTGDAVC